MVGMAVSAGQVGIILAQNTVQRGLVQPLDGHVSVTGNTPIGHRCVCPKWSMTKVALAGDFCMGVHPAQWFGSLCSMRADTTQRISSPCVEAAGTEHHTARCESESSHDEGGQNSGHDAGGGETTHPSFFHLLPIAGRLRNTMPHRYG